MNEEKFELAIEMFNKSYEFFSRNKWLDNWRYLVLLSSNKISFRAMALLNIALCYVEIGNMKNAKEYYERVLKEFSDSEFSEAVKVSLEIIEDIKKEKTA